MLRSTLRHRSALALVAAAALSATTASSVFARDNFRGSDRDDHDRGRRYESRAGGRDDDRRDNYRGSVGIHVSSGPSVICPPPPPRVIEERVWVEPVYRTVIDRRWVEPVYRTVYDRVWVEPVTRTEFERVWLPDRFEWRDVVHTDRYGRRYTTKEKVLAEPGHFEEQKREVVLAPGHYEDRHRQELLCAGRWETCERQELVCAGHWVTRPVVVAAPYPRPYEQSHARIDLRFPIGR